MSGKSELKHWVILVFLSIIWGTSFILIKKSLIAFAPLEVAILRVGISGIAFIPFFIYKFRTLEWNRWWFYFIIALTGSGIPAILYATAQTRLSSATSGILNSITPIFTLIIGVVIFKNLTSPKQVIGSVIGFIGAAALVLLDKPLDSGQGIPIFFAMLVIIGTVLYGANVNLIKEYFQDVEPMQLSSFAFVLLGLPVCIFIPFSDIPDKVVLHPEGFSSLMALVLLALMSTVLAIIIFYKLVQDTSAVFASTVAYIIPIVALVWGVLDGEYIGMMHLASMGIILLGVYLIRAGQTPTLKKEKV